MNVNVDLEASVEAVPFDAFLKSPDPASVECEVIVHLATSGPSPLGRQELGVMKSMIRFVPDPERWTDGVGGAGTFTLDGHELGTVEDWRIVPAECPE